MGPLQKPHKVHVNRPLTSPTTGSAPDYTNWLNYSIILGCWGKKIL